METPAPLVEHQDKYKNKAWTLYSIAELGQAVHFFMKRATHRTDTAKKMKDLIDASNYCAMMKAQVDAAMKEAKMFKIERTGDDLKITMPGAEKPKPLGLDEFEKIMKENPEKLGLKKKEDQGSGPGW
jgi:hypothetical protein